MFVILDLPQIIMEIVNLMLETVPQQKVLHVSFPLLTIIMNIMDALQWMLVYHGALRTVMVYTVEKNGEFVIKIVPQDANALNLIKSVWTEPVFVILDLPQIKKEIVNLMLVGSTISKQI